MTKLPLYAITGSSTAAQVRSAVITFRDRLNELLGDT